MTNELPCVIYRCSRQDEMYLYVRAGTSIETLPEALRQRTGKLTPVMELSLKPERKLARVDVARVIEQVAQAGYYLQMPPAEHIQAHLHFGD